MTNQPINKNIRQRGFTLIEIMIAILILGLVLSTIYVAYNGAMRIVRDIEYENHLYKMARTAMDRMIKDLSSLQLASGAFDFRAGKIILSNREFYALSFWSAAHLAFGENESEGRPASISYHVEKDEGRDSFSLWRSDLSGAKPSKEKNISGGFVVCQNIESLKLRFYDSTGSELESWDSSSFSAAQQGRAPVALKIELALVNLNEKEKPYKFMTKVFLPVKN